MDLREEILNGLKFPDEFTKWVMACITTPSFTLHMNGKDYGQFDGERGLTQGDPLSPLLFVIMMEYLSRLFKDASRKKGFIFYPQCKKLGLVHLMFAEDLIVFSAADPQSVTYLMEAFAKFTRGIGLEANQAKS